MTSLLAVGYETRLGYDSHLESSQIWSGPTAWDCFFLIARVLHRLDLGRELKNKFTLSLLIKVNLCLLKQLLLGFLNHYEECHISRSLSSLADIEALRPIGACPKRETASEAFANFPSQARAAELKHQRLLFRHWLLLSGMNL